MLQDLRFALRLFRKHPAPIGIAVGGLALAIGVVTAVFSLVHASLLRPYGMHDPASVVRVGRPDHGGWSQWMYARFRQLREASTLSTVEASMAGRVRFSTVAGDDAGRHTVWPTTSRLSLSLRDRCQSIRSTRWRSAGRWSR